LNKSIDLILEFGEALHSYGAASYNLEQALQNIAKQLGVEAEFFAAPTLLISGFKIDGESKTYVKRVYPANVDLRKLTYLDTLGDQLIEGNVDVEQAYAELKRIRNLKENSPEIIEIIAYGLAALCVSIFFNANNIEAIAAFFAGTTVGIVSTMLNDKLKHFSEFMAAFLASVVALIFTKYFQNYSYNIVVLASLIVIIPGLSLTIAITELATLNLASGTARLMQSILVFFKLAFGVALAMQFLNLWGIKPHNILPNIEVAIMFKSSALFVACLSFCILFRIPLRFYLWVLSAGALSFFSTYYGINYFGLNITTFLAGFLVCLLSNAFARWRKKPALLLELPGLMLIVPGSVGFKGLQSFVENNSIAGIDSIFNMFLIAIALVSGFLLANILLVPKRSL